MSIPTDTGRATTGRWVPLSGVAFVVLALAAIVGIGGDTPDSEASAAKVSSFYGAHDHRQTIAGFVLMAAVPFLIFFGVSLASAMWPREAGRRPFWPIVLVSGSVLAAGAFAVSAFVHVALADGAGTVTDGTLQGLNVLDGDTWVAFNGSLGVMMLGAAGSLIPAARGYRVLGWIALVAGVALFIPYADFIALLVTAIWILVASVMLFRREPEPA
jgi:hypothetical protein